jgi:excisionase family DNA binding protein
MNNDEILSIKEVAAILNLSTDEVAKLIDNGTIKSELVNGKRMIWRNNIPSLRSTENHSLDLKSAAAYIGETEEALKEFYKKRWIAGTKENGNYAFPFKELYKYLHFTKKLKP